MFSIFNFLIFFTLLIFIILCTYFDLKKRIIPNKLIFIFLILFLCLFLIKLVLFFSFSLLCNTFLSVTITFVVFYLLWEFGVIAGGDLKFFLVVSILLPFNLSIFSNFFNIGLDLTLLKYPIFTIFLLFSSFLMMLPYILVFSIIKLFTKKNLIYFKRSFFTKNNFENLFLSTLSLFLVSIIVSFFALSFNLIFLFIFSFILFNLIILLKNKNHNSFICFLIFSFSVLIILEIILKKPFLMFGDLGLIFVINISVSFLLFLIKFTKENILTTPISISHLQEGIVLSKNYYFNKQTNKLTVENTSFVNQFKRLVAGTYYLNLKIDSNKAGGLNKEDIAFLNTMYENNLIGNKVFVKKTLPFMPVVLMTFIVLNFIKF